MPNVFSYDEVYRNCLEYFKGDELAAGVIINKYLLRNEKNELIENHPSMMFERIASEFARIEQNYPNSLSLKEIHNWIDDFKFIVPQGSPLFGIGNDYQTVSLANCFVIAPVEDSYGDIFRADEELAQLMKRRGGCGIDISNLRPKGTDVNNAARTSEGAVSFMHRFSSTTKEVAQGGRRGALMISIDCRHPDLMDFIDVKRNLTSVTGANISVKWNTEFMQAVKENKDFTLQWPIEGTPKITKVVKAKEVWDKFIQAVWESGEPGCLFWNNIVDNSLTDCYADEGFKTVSTNPCITGDTLVYTANGRGNVSIKTLAEEGNDIPVMCYDNDGKVCIRTMRNPRITGYNQPIYKVTLDDGYTVRVTENHKFRLLDGTYKQVKDLKAGDSLKILTRFEASIKDIFPGANTRSSDYYWINNGQTANIGEHRLIASEFNKTEIKSGYVVHHKDFNSKNNCPENLQILSSEEHNVIHTQNMYGDKNPMRRAHFEWSEEKWNEYRLKMSNACSGEKNGRYENISNEQIKQLAINLTKQLNRRFSQNEFYEYFKQNTSIKTLSDFRIKELGTITELSYWASEQCGLKNQNYDNRVLRTLQKALDMGYNAFIDEVSKSVYVEKHCENCSKTFITPFFRRETSYCSSSCGNIKINALGLKKHNPDKNKQKVELQNTKQLDIYCHLKNILQTEPTLKQWIQECKNQNIPHRLNGSKFGFKSFKELSEMASLHNHRIVSIELDGYENVYNGTVDDFHNFFIGAFEGKTKNNKNKWIYINNLQCGELPLNSAASCELMLMNLKSFVDNNKFDFNKFKEACFTGIRLMDDMIDLEIEKVNKIITKIESDPESSETKFREKNLWLKVKENHIKGRRIGFGITALADCIALTGIKYGSKEAIDFINEILSKLNEYSMIATTELAKERGAFPIYNWEKEKNNCYIKLCSQETQDLIKKYGRRNISLTTIAPAGTISIMTQTSSGCEPVYMRKYVRRRKVNNEDKARGIKITNTDADGIEWTSYDVFHPTLKSWLEQNPNKTEKDSPWFGCQADELNWEQRVKTQATLQKYITNSISSTCNLPANVTKEEISKIYISAWEQGCKGITVYRDGCRQNVLSSGVKEEKKTEKNEIVPVNSPKRPDILECDIHYSTVLKENWIFFIGKLNGHPYEIFGGPKKNIELPKRIKTGWIKKNGIINGIRTYDLIVGSLTDEDEKMTIKDISSEFSVDVGSYTRLVSTMLRHGVPIKYICEQLNKDTESVSMFSLEKTMSRVLKKYIKDGESAGNCHDCGGQLAYKDGCVTCLSCGISKCS